MRKIRAPSGLGDGGRAEAWQDGYDEGYDEGYEDGAASVRSHLEDGRLRLISLARKLVSVVPLPGDERGIEQVLRDGVRELLGLIEDLPKH